MGDGPKRALRMQFDSQVKLEFHGTRITSDAGLLVFRELDEAFLKELKGSGKTGSDRSTPRISVHQHSSRNVI